MKSMTIPSPSTSEITAASEIRNLSRGVISVGRFAIVHPVRKCVIGLIGILSAQANLNGRCRVLGVRCQS